MKDDPKLLSLPLQEGKMTESNKHMYDCACAHIFVCAYVCGGQETIWGVVPQKEETKDSRPGKLDLAVKPVLPQHVSQAPTVGLGLGKTALWSCYVMQP